MKKDAQLPDNIEQLKALLLRQQSEINKLKHQNQHLLEQFRLAQQKQFGKSSEGFTGQGELFDEVEETQTDTAQTQTISYERKKPTRKPLPLDLPREEVMHDITDKHCACCGHDLHKMGEDRTEKLEFIPASVKVMVHVRPKYSCRHCEKHATNTPIKQQPLPPSPIPKGFATPSLLAQLISSKYQYGLPLYRQERLFKHYGIELGRKTMSDWILKSATLFTPLLDRFKQTLLKQPVIQADETTVNVIHSDKAKSYMWLYCTGTDSPVDNHSIPNIVLFDYQNSRAGSCPAHYLSGFNGYLQVDGYAGYEQTDTILVGCMAHARRYFMEAKKAQPSKKSGTADMALSYIQKLYAIEKKNKDKTAADIYQARQTYSKPIVEAFYQWLTKRNVVPKSALGKAITYCVNQWPKLIRYLENGQLNIDNNRAERAIKPFVIGRKNWLFSQTANGANASAALYSIIETAKANGLVPFEYLMTCLEALCQPEPDIDSLLPWNIKS